MTVSEASLAPTFDTNKNLLRRGEACLALTISLLTRILVPFFPAVLISPFDSKSAKQGVLEGMPEDNEGGFKVTDRRLFNPDGSLREQLPEEAPAPAPATVA